MSKYITNVETECGALVITAVQSFEKRMVMPYWFEEAIKGNKMNAIKALRAAVNEKVDETYKTEEGIKGNKMSLFTAKCIVESITDN